MSGNAFANSDTGYVMVDYTQTQIDPNVAEYNENGISVDVVCIGGFGKFDENGEFNNEYWPNNSYSVTITWDANEVTPYGSEVMYVVDGVEESIPLNINTTEGQATAQFTLPDGASIKAVDLAYNIADSEGESEQQPEQEPTGDGKVNEPPIFDTNTIYAKYLENMNALGSLDNKVRSIGTDASISEEAWKDWVNKFNASDNKMIIEGSGEEYKVYISLDNKTKGELVETIIIKFYDASNKGWLPEITPGTGQSIAVGGIVVLVVAGVGLLVNNKKKKDEEK